MKIIMFSAEDYERPLFARINADHGHELTYIEARLTCDTVGLADGYEGLCAFINDNLNADILKTLAQGGTKLIALRSAGFNNVDLDAAKTHGLSVVRVPAYSPPCRGRARDLPDVGAEPQGSSSLQSCP